MMPLGAGAAADLRETPEAVRRQADSLAAPVAALVRELLRRPPVGVVTCARGSSAHAASFAKHLIELHVGIPVAAAAPNIATIYHRPLRLKDHLFLAISQSGRSDDLIETTIMAKAGGALTVALVNDPESRLAAVAEIILPLGAGPERSIAATKSFTASLAGLLRLTAQWTGSDAMRAACDGLPARLAAASELDWSEALDPLAIAHSLLTIGRGSTLAIAREAALKFKEACALHAEAFSSAEFRHGPITLIASAYPVLIFAPTDEAAAGLSDLAAELTGRGGCVLMTQPDGKPPGRLPALPAVQPDADAICLIQSFYGFLIRLASRRGCDIDRPRHLQKVTRTR